MKNDSLSFIANLIVKALALWFLIWLFITITNKSNKLLKERKTHDSLEVEFYKKHLK